MDFGHAEISGNHYHFIDGTPCTLNQLVRAEPEWATMRVKHGEIMEKKLAALSATPAQVDVGKVMEGIKRYEMESHSRGFEPDYNMEENTDGEYVKYADVLSRLRALPTVTRPDPVPVDVGKALKAESELLKHLRENIEWCAQKIEPIDGSTEEYRKIITDVSVVLWELTKILKLPNPYVHADVVAFLKRKRKLEAESNKRNQEFNSSLRAFPTVTRPDPVVATCPKCGGTGGIDTSDIIPCPMCHGTGKKEGA